MWSLQPEPPAAESSGFQDSFARLLEDGRAPTSFRLDLRFRAPLEIPTADLLATLPHADRARRPRPLWIAAVSMAAIAGSAWNAFGDDPHERFHFTNEGWFGRNTYAGGADKASHFVSYNAVARLLTEAYRAVGVSTDAAGLLGSGVSVLAGLVTEIGDGTNRYGFSYEDVVADFVGAASALAIAHYGLDDLIGFRAGLVPAPDVEGQPNGGFGKNYSQEIYTADLKIAGLARRLRIKPGPARFLLFSVSYGAKGYPYAVPEARERQVGFEVGLHLTEIMRAAGIPENRWWSRPLYIVLDIVRFPFTAVGFRYDLNHRAWRGPDTGDSFPGGGR